MDQNEALFFSLLDGFMQISKSGFNDWDKTQNQWNSFKQLIKKRPIDYHQVFNFICKLQELELPRDASVDQLKSGGTKNEKPQNQQCQQRTNNFIKSSQSTSFQAQESLNENFSIKKQTDNGHNFHTPLNQPSQTYNENDLFSAGKAYMFKTAGGNLQSNLIQSQKRDEQQQPPARSSTRDNALLNLGMNSSIGNYPSQRNNNVRSSLNSGLSNSNNQTGHFHNSTNMQHNFQMSNMKDTNNNNNDQFQIEENSVQQQASQEKAYSHQRQQKRQFQLESDQKQGGGGHNQNHQQNNISGNVHHSRENRNAQVSDEEVKLYSVKSFDKFLKENTKIHLGSNKSAFANTNVISLSHESNTLLRFVAISLFMNLLQELPHPDSPPDTSCAQSKQFLIDLFMKVHNKKLKIYSSPLQSSSSAEEMHASFIKNTGQLLQLYFLHGQTPQKLASTFLHQIQQDIVYLDSLAAVIKDLASEFVEESEYEAIAWCFNQQQNQQQVQPLSMASTCASLSQLGQDKTNEKEKRQKLAHKLRNSKWSNEKPEWVFLLSLALQRPIELFNLKDHKLEQILFKSKKIHVSEIVSKNKINILTLTLSSNTTPQAFFLMTMSEQESNLFQQAISIKRTSLLGLRLNEELNLQYLIKQINSQYSNPNLLNTPSQEYPPSLGQQITQQISSPSILSSQPTLQHSGSNPHLMNEVEYSMGHRSSKLGTHMNNLQNQERQQQSQNHTQSIEEISERKSHSIRSNQQSALASAASNNSVPINSTNTPRIQAFASSSSSQKIGLSPDSKLQLGGSIGKGQILNNFQKPAGGIGNLSSNMMENNLLDEQWNKAMLFGKVKDLIFKLNVNSDMLNGLSKFPTNPINQTSNNNISLPSNNSGYQSKENIHPKSPLKYKNVLYPLNSQLQQYPQTRGPQANASPLQFTIPQSPPGLQNAIGFTNSSTLSSNTPIHSQNNNSSYYAGNSNYGGSQIMNEQRQVNNLGSYSPSPSLGLNSSLQNSTNQSLFQNNISKVANNIQTQQSYLGPNTFSQYAANSANQQRDLSNNQQNGTPSSQITIAGAGWIKRQIINQENGKQEQQREIFNKLSPRRNLNTQY